MSNPPQQTEEETLRTLAQIASGDTDGWQTVSEQHRQRLHRLVSMRMDQRMQSRVDASDVVQDTLLEAYQKIEQYLDDPKLPFYLWLRSIAGHKLMSLHRFHLGTDKRKATKEVSRQAPAFPDATSALLVAQLVGDQSRPSEIVAREENKRKLEECLDELEPIDREVLMLRHYEQLNNAEVAKVLSLSISAASKRYLRALTRIRSVLEPFENRPDS